MHPLSNMQVFAISADSVSNYQPKNGKTLLIRILDDNYEYKHIQYLDNYESVYEMNIIDIDLTHYEHNDIDDIKLMFKDTLFTQKHARDLIAHLQQHDPESISQIVVHCMAGISRSVAIAYFIAEYYLHNHVNAQAILDCNLYIYGGNAMIREILTETWCEITNETPITWQERD